MNHWCSICGNVCKKYNVVDGQRIVSDYCCLCRELYHNDVVNTTCNACQPRINSILQRVDDKLAYQQGLEHPKHLIDWRLIG